MGVSPLAQRVEHLPAMQDLNIYVSRSLLFLNVREPLMSSVKCIAFRADFQAGLKDIQSCTSVNSWPCTAFSMAQGAAAV